MADAKTLQVRVQVVDIQPSNLELMLPAFLPAGDLSQRIARDAGLEAFTEDGRRKTFWLRARGRVLEENETLADLNIIDHELLHLLPEPPLDSGVVEQEGVEADVGQRESTPRMVMALVWPVLWAFFWGLALTVDREWWATLVPGLALGMLCVSMAKRVIFVRGRDLKLLLTAFGLCALMLPLALVPAIYLGQDPGTVLGEASPGIVAAVLGAVVGWLAWWEPIEALPASTRQASGIASAADVVEASCGLCGGVVEKAVQQNCHYSCGQVFHRGCFQARMSAAGGSDSECGICGAELA